MTQRPVNVFTFTDSREAYDASQTHDEIHDGDVLYVPSQRIVGYLYMAWPVAVTTERGEFHGLTEDCDPLTMDDGKYAASHRVACALATECW